MNDETLVRSGVQVMLTESGTAYLLDLEHMQLRRVPRIVAPLAAGVVSASLRRDREWLTILHIRRLEVGAPAVFVLEPLGDPAVTLSTTRTTTEVRWIRPIEEVLL
jgi:hypothetical protein